jgi:hypothetical protein
VRRQFPAQLSRRIRAVRLQRQHEEEVSMIDHLGIANHIAQLGVYISGAEEQCSRALVYSVGRHQRGWAELAMRVGSWQDRELASGVLLLLAYEPVRAGDRIEFWPGGPSWTAMDLRDEPDEARPCLNDAHVYYGHDVEVLVLVSEIEMAQKELRENNHRIM